MLFVGQALNRRFAWLQLAMGVPIRFGLRGRHLLLVDFFATVSRNAVTQKCGPSPKAFIVLPLVSAFFLDLVNAVLIPFFLHKI